MLEITADYMIGICLLISALCLMAITRIFRIDKTGSNPQAKPRVTDRGQSMLREHSKLPTIPAARAEIDDLRRRQAKLKRWHERGRSAEAGASEPTQNHD